jgi:hypothetical protein
VAVAMLQESPELTAEMYDAVDAKLNAAGDPPEGLIMHTSGPMQGGGFRIFDVWESMDAWNRFNEERLGPAIQEAMGDQTPAEPPPPPELYELHDLIKP